MKLIWIAFTLLFFASSCRVLERIDAEQVSNEVKAIRDGQVTYKKKFDRYGTLQDLAREGLASKAVADGNEWGFSFALEADHSSYQLRVQEVLEAGKKPNRELVSYFLDESGAIRGSIDPAKPADSASDRIY